MARFRSFAVNLLNANDIQNLADAIYKNTLNFDNVRKLKYLWTEN